MAEAVCFSLMRSAAHEKRSSSVCYLLAYIRSLGGIALALTSSGIAATLLEGGRTAHSALKLPLDIHFAGVPTCNISKGSGMAKVLQTCILIV